VRLTQVRVENVRSIVAADVPLAGDFTFITGPNGAGKTNLLEAIHLCATLRPLTTTTPKELVRRGSERAAVDGVLEGGVLPLDVRVVVQRGRRHAWVAGKPLVDADAYLGTLPTVSFTPDDLGLVKSGPAERRAFFGRAAAELWPGARDETRRLERVLRQRAAALRRGASNDIVQALDGPLVAASIRVWRRRQALLSDVLPYATGWLSHLLAGHTLDVHLVPGLPGTTELATIPDDALADRLHQALATSLDQDRRRGQTAVGPHHDEFDVRLDSAEARRFASQGQQRCCALALTLGVVDAVHQARGRPPLVLLDDVSSELDGHRREALFGALALSNCQVVATATDVSLLPVPAGFGGLVRHHAARDGTFADAD
jgi:DNA replication and repair protein RecF